MHEARLPGPKLTDIAIIGGGVIGHAVAFRLLEREPDLSVTIFERDLTYRMASSGLSVGGIRQQFGTAVNVAICRDSVAFYANVTRHLGTSGEHVDIGFHQNGYLFLATERSLPVFQARAEMARALGVPVEIVSAQRAAEITPGLNLEGIAGASYCASDGYLDPHLVLMAFRQKAKALGAELMEDEVTSVEIEAGRAVGVRTHRQGTLAAGRVIVAAGGWTRPLLLPSGLDLPVRPYRRQVFVVQPRQPLQDFIPLTIDPSGLHFRPETGGRLLVAHSLPSDGESLPLEFDRDAFTEHLWAPLAYRVPALEELRLEHGWAGYYDDNAADHNAIVGAHPDVLGLYVITGFSGHGLMQCPAVSRGLAELILTGSFETLDLRPLRPERFLENDLILEQAVI